MTQTHYDDLEIQTPLDRSTRLLGQLPALVAHAQTNTGAFADILKGVDATGVNSLAALAQLPVTRKHELLARQQAGRAADAFGGFSTLVYGKDMPHVFASPGAIYEPEGNTPDYWRTARALYGAGFRAGELIHNCFSYHFTPAGSMMDCAARAMGCTVFPGGIGQTEQQVTAMAELKPAGYIGTPSFLRIILDKAAEMGIALPSVTKALVSGEALPPSLRAWFKDRGIAVYQCYATADVGLIAYETSALEGMVIDEGVIVEIVRPGTGEPVPEGDVGELVITTLNPAYPLIRFGTGDLSAVLSGSCPTGRTNKRITGWMGRADQTTKVRGMFVHPGQVNDVMRKFPELTGRARLVVTGAMANDAMSLHVEAESISASLLERLGTAVRETTKLRADIVAAAPGSLPNDGKVIEDARSYD
ncbi:MAG: AMP-binding protein [Burkholderiaceae bacterium]